ncbi:pyridoxal-phosphate dependent enzyme [Micromonospora sp. NBC_01796]|uniref:pyridoxal-phosphate dependent enzyme n=1 Tax=Micromonospora sp. NBC_01796 TaxID=2975987 RepID=UPI002DDB9EF1|nr:pyridoxal-phosphate dependent enzyme [Micromonospora sp. NBC_01796]WSA84456.1 pyridoxal-phosphate dependent enzyme [Micromonospora sp. NBC_01796]
MSIDTLAAADEAPTDAYGTPLIEAAGLVPGVRILVKDETRYASGSHKEPAARAVVARAIADGYRHVVVATCGNYGRAMAMATRAAGLTCTVVLPQGWSDGGAFMRAAGARVHLVAGSYEDAVDESRRLAAEDGAIDGNVDGPYVDAVFAGHGVVVPALREVLGEPPAALWIPVGNGTTIIAVHRQLRALDWPTVINGVGSAGNNPVLTSWPGEYRMLPPDGVSTTDHNQPLVNWHALQGPEAMAAIADTGGEAYGVDDRQLCDARTALARYGAHPTAAGAVALAGLLARADAVGLAPGTHVVLLSGR